MTPNDFINRMLVLYGEPDTPDVDMFFDEYRAVIGSTEPRVLNVAASIIRDEHEFRTGLCQLSSERLSPALRCASTDRRTSQTCRTIRAAIQAQPLASACKSLSRT